METQPTMMYESWTLGIAFGNSISIHGAYCPLVVDHANNIRITLWQFKIAIEHGPLVAFFYL
jgi:hypothetical protein